MELFAAQMGIIFLCAVAFVVDSVISAAKPVVIGRAPHEPTERALVPTTAAEVVKVTSTAWAANGPELAVAA